MVSEMAGKNKKRKSFFIFIPIAFVFPLIIYFYTLIPKLAFIDAGELITVSRTLGIAHPTGYPLFTILGRCFSLLPFGSVAFRINIISALFSSAASLFLYLYLIRITDCPFTSITGSLLFAFSRIVWHQSTSAEVYSITFFFITFLFFLHSSHIKNRLVLIAYISGVSLANHIIIITFLIPFFVYLLVNRELRWTRNLFYFALFFILGITLYLYLPIRGSQNPIMNWGKPVTFERFLWHITGKQYRVWMFTGNLLVIKKNLIQFVKLISVQYTPLLLVFSFLGVFHLFFISKKRFFFLLALLVINATYAVNYDIPDIEPYYIISVFAYIIFILYGLFFIVKKIPRLRLGIVILPLFVLFYNFHYSNERNNYFAYDLCKNLFYSVKKGGIVITNNWDYYSPSLYIRYIEGERKDIVMIDKELLRRSWYFDYLKKEFPWLIKKSDVEVTSYLRLLDDFEHSRLTNAAEIQQKYIDMINSFIDKNISRRPCYVTFGNKEDRDAKFIAPEYDKIPVGILYEVSKLPDTTFFDYSKFHLRGVFNKYLYKDERTLLNLSVYPRMSFEKGIYLIERGKFSSALKTFDFAKRWKNTEVAATAFEATAALFLNQYKKSITLFKEVYKNKPDDKMVEVAIKMLESNRQEELKNRFSKLLKIKRENETIE